MTQQRLSTLCLAALVCVSASCSERDAAPATNPPTRVIKQALGIPPVNTIPAPQTVSEDSPLMFSALVGNSLAVSDADNATVTLQVIVTNGIFNPTSGTDVAITGTGTFSVTLSGPIGGINEALDEAFFTPAPNYTGPATLQMNTSDIDGNSTIDVLNITVTPANDPPTNNVPTSSQIATEDVPRSFNLSVNDVDLGSNPLVVTLTSSNGTLITLPVVTGLVFSGGGDGTNDAAMTFTGSLPDVNAALNGVTVTPPLNFIGSSTLVITANDQGATGAGMAGSDTDTISISWAAVNDNPVNAVPSAQNTIEEMPITLGSGTATALTVSDVDATTTLVQVTLSGTGGTLTLANPSLVSFNAGDGTADSSMTFNGTLVNLNAALDNLVYTPNLDFAGNGAVTIITSDLGNSGSGGTKTDTDSVQIVVAAVNDAPVNTVPAAQVTNEDTARIFSGTNGNAIAALDVDATSLLVTLTATNGTMTLSGIGGLSFQTGDGTGDATMTFDGTEGSINTALNGLSFMPTANTSGPASISIVVSDQGATGSGGARTDSDTIAITVNPVNDVPNAVNDLVSLGEDAAATPFPVLGNDSFAPDTGETLTITSITSALHGVATHDGSAITYTPNANYNGVDSVSYTISDGNGGTDTATMTITVNAVNDAPNATNDSFTVLQNSGPNPMNVLSNDSAAPDVGETLTITLVSTPANGSAAIVNGGLGLTYTPTGGFTGSDSFTYTVSDGNGGVDVATVSVSVSMVNTTPVNTLPGPQLTNEDTQLVFSSLAGNAISVADANSTTLTVQISTTNGTFTLGSTTGLTVMANGSSSVSAQGTIMALNSALNGSRYLPSPNFNGPATLTINTNDSTGETDLDTLTLTVSAINDAPVNTLPSGAQTGTEDTPRTFTTISVTDVDVGAGQLQVTLAGDNGTTITLPSTGGLAFSAGDGVGDATMTFTGTLPDVNAAFNGLTVTPPLNFIGSSTLVITSNDQGNIGAGGVGQDTDTINFTWSAVNDAPVNVVPSAQATTEEMPMTFSSALGNGMSLSDVDVSAGLLQVSLSATGGTLTLGSTAGLSFAAGDGAGDGAMTFSGTVAALNTALNGTVFSPAANFAGPAVVTLTTNDLGNSGAGGARQDLDTITVDVAAQNDAPLNTVPIAQSTNEDVSRVFSTSNGNAISVADVDAPTLQVSLSGTNGLLSLSGVAGLTFQAGDGVGDGTMTFTGTIGAINTAVNGLTFAPAPHFFGPASVTVLTSDLGSTGSGGTLIDSDTITVTVSSVNDAPDAVNDAATVNEDSGPTSFSVLLNDTFAPDLGETLSLSSVTTPGNGTASISGSTVTYTPNGNFNGTDSFSYTVSDGSGGTDTATVTLTVVGINDDPTAADDSFTVLQNSGPNALSVLSNDTALPDVGEALTVTAVTAPTSGTAMIAMGGTGVTYQPNAGFSGTDTFTYTTSDGNGGTDVATVTVDVSLVNTRPVNTLPGPQLTNEDTQLVFSTLGGNAISVADANSTTLTVQISVTNGTFTLGAITGLTVMGNGSSSVSAQGTLAALNNALNNSRYQPTPNFNGGAALTINTNDSTGETDLDTLTLTVSAINDSPLHALPTGSQTATEDTPRTFTSISVTDVDVGAGQLRVTLTADNGTTVSLPSTAGLSFTAGDGSADTAMSFAGTLPDVNAAFNGLTVTPPLNYIGASTLVITTNDQGNTGGGGVGQDTDTINFTWGAVNDAPVNAVPVAQATGEETVMTFSSALGNGLSISDVDVSAGLLQVTVSATGGTLTLGGSAGLTFTAGDGTADGSMTMSGTLAALNTALNGTTFTPASNFAGAAAVTITTSDLGNSGSGGAKQDVDTVSVAVGAVNDPPANTVPSAQATNEDVNRVFSASNGNAITVADVDAPTLQVSLSAANGAVSLSGVAGLTFQAGDGTGDGTMTFTGAIGAINTALNGLSFTPGTHFFGSASLTVLTSDLGATGAGGTLLDTDTITIAVASINDPPDAANDAATVAEDSGATSFTVLSNDTFAPDVSETLTITTVTTPGNGTAAIMGSSITYTPAANFNGTDSFSYTIADGNGGTDTATLSLTVTAVNDDPAAADDTFTVLQNSTPNALTVLSNDSALPDLGEALTISTTSTPANGTVAITGMGTGLTYQPTSGFTGNDSFTYTISDGNGGLDTATVSISVLTVNPNPVNTLPPPQLTLEDTQLVFSAANGNAIAVTDANSPSITVQISVTSGTFTLSTTTGLTVTGSGTSNMIAQGTLANLNTALNGARYVPALNYNGSATLTMNSNDTSGNSDLDTLTLTVSAVNDLPVNTTTAMVMATEDVPRTFSTVSVADVDVGASDLRITLAADNGVLITLGSTVGIAFTVGDGAGDATMTFTGTLARVNAALNGLAITPPSNFIGASTLILTTNDQGNTGGGGPGQDVDTMNITWASDNDAPINSVPPAQTVAEEGTFVFSAAAGTGLSTSDLDVSAGLMRVTLSSTNGRVTLGNSGAVTIVAGTGVNDVSMAFTGTLAAVNSALDGSSFTPNVNFVGNAVVTLLVSDQGNTGGGGARSDTDTITIAVTGVNDAPVNNLQAMVQNINEDTSLVFNNANGNLVTVADVDATSLQVTLSTANGTIFLMTRTGLTFQAGDGTAAPTMTFSGLTAAVNGALNAMRFTAAPHFNGMGSLLIQTRDLGATGAGGALSDEDSITINVAPINDAPSAVADAVTLVEDSPATDLTPLDNDTIAPDTGEALTITGVSTPMHGTAVNNGTFITYRPTANYVGPDSFTYTINDGNGGTSTATVSVTMTSVNDPPDALDDALSVMQGAAATNLPVLSNDTFAPDTGETLSITAVTMATNGTVLITGGGSGITYQPASNFFGTDTFSYTISDGNGGSDSATVTVNVSNVDAMPMAIADTLMVAEDASANVTVLANDTGLLNGPVVVTIATAPLHGTAMVQGDNSILYTPAANYVGSDTVTYTVTDVDGDASTATVVVTVTAVDDLPMAMNDAATTDEDTSVRIEVLLNDTALVDLPVTVTVTTAASTGTTTVEVDGAVTYVPNANTNGEDTFTYTATDGDGDMVMGVVTVTVAAVNDAPVAMADTASVRPQVEVIIDVLLNDTDVEADALLITAVGTPTAGVATITSDNKVSYVSTGAAMVTDTFSYEVSDSNGGTATGMVTVGVGLDSDGDGLLDADEPAAGTDPMVADTDGDEVNDGLEVKVTMTNPLDDDSDDDGLLDGHEDVNANGMLDGDETDPRNADTDGDGLLDGTEKGLAMPEGNDTQLSVFIADADPPSKTDPRKADTDGGGLSDGQEDPNHNGKIDLRETDPNKASDDMPPMNDMDGDGIDDSVDNCPSVPNMRQTDSDNDGIGDACPPPKSGCGCASGAEAPVLLLGLAMILAAGRRRRLFRA